MAVEIVLSENRLHTLQKNSKRTLNDSNVERLFGELIWAGSPREFKRISIFLRELTTKGSKEESASANAVAILAITPGSSFTSKRT